MFFKKKEKKKKISFWHIQYEQVVDFDEIIQLRAQLNKSKWVN